MSHPMSMYDEAPNDPDPIPTRYPYLPCPVCGQESVIITDYHNGTFDTEQVCDCTIDYDEAIEEYRELGVFQDEEE